MRKLRRKLGAVGTGIVVAALLASVGAFAYYVVFAGVSGSGNTTAGTAGSTGNTQTQAAIMLTPTFGAYTGTGCTDLSPGCNQKWSLSATNNDSVNSHHITSLGTPTISVDSVHATAGCQASWFTVSPDSTTLNADPMLTAGQTGVAVGDGLNTISFTEVAGTDQSSCKSATLTLSFPTATGA